MRNISIKYFKIKMFYENNFVAFVSINSTYCLLSYKFYKMTWNPHNIEDCNFRAIHFATRYFTYWICLTDLIVLLD